MYNRYTPQSDGSYRKNRIPEPIREQTGAQKRPPFDEAPSNEQGCIDYCEHPNFQPPQPPYHSKPQGSSITGFLRNLLPTDFDTGDLLVVLLLLLMAGDCNDDNNTALLTLALYLFM